ncbi:MAG: efflux RND transporter periplasmic adaptor subunit [Candidatus Schekmanbacteria bacterium]|nr:efflux RND transporter periplasmic adaptor subunit [Candidatus Schekmanbacteria bacterium]
MSGNRYACGVLLLAVMALAGCEPPTSATRERPPVPVEIVTVEPRDVRLSYQEMSTLKAARTVVIAAEVAGRILRLPTDVGDHARAGEAIVVLDASVPDAQLAQARERLRQAEVAAAAARRGLERMVTLRDKGAATAEDLEEAGDRAELAQADVAVARAAVATAAAVLVKYTITAPSEGVITMRDAEPGEMVAPGAPIIELSDIDPLRAEVHVPESVAQHIRGGMKVSVEVEALPLSTTGEVYRVAPSVDARSRTVKIEIDVARGDPRLLPGMFARVTFVLQEQHGVLAVPVTAMRREADGSAYALAAVTGTGAGDATVLEKRPVETGLEAGGWVEVRRGLNAGEAVVTLGAASIAPGTRVAPKTAGAAEPTTAPAPTAPPTPVAEHAQP